MWKPVFLPTIRLLINDFDASNYKYTDEQIYEMSCVAAIYVAQDYSFSTDYTIDITNTDISPDPVTSSDDEFVALVTLKAACLFNIAQYSLAVRTGIKVRSGEDSVDLTSGFGGYRDILELGPCASYDKLLKHIRNGGGTGLNGVKYFGGTAVANMGTHPDSGYYGRGTVRFFNSFNRGGF